MVKRLSSFFFSFLLLSLLTVNALATETPNSAVEIVEQQVTDEVSVEQQIETEAEGSDQSQELIGGVIKANNVIVRNGPTRETEKICALEKGTQVVIIQGSEVENLDEFGNRIKIKIGDVEGYIAKKYLYTEEELQQIEDAKKGEWQLLSTATTQASANSNRDVNISIASNYINEKILQPNEQFSFWDTVGKCTYAKGYKDATVYANGKKTTGIGGGVCQVSTTVNIAAKNAGIATKAKQHSLPVSYASRENEATVSYGNQDFKFTNTTGKVIKLVMTSGKGACTCEIWMQN